MNRHCARMLRVLAAVLIVVGGLSLAATRASASTAAPGSGMVITAFSAPGDWIGGGQSAEFDGTNATIQGTAANSVIKLSVVQGEPSPNFWSFLIAPPRGTAFHVGYFPGAQDATTRAQGHPGLYISGPGTGCDWIGGSIDIRDLALSGSKIIRLDLLYTQYCDASAGALFGEIRINEPEPAGMLVSASSITWPPTGAGGPITVPVVIENRSKKRVPVSAATLTGYAASNFRVSGGGCAGHSLAPGDSCSFLVTFTASTPGPRTADLQIKLGQESDQIQLDAPVPAGTTSLVMTSQPGDWVGQGRSWNFNASNAGFIWIDGHNGGNASPTDVTEDVKIDDQWFTTASLIPAAGHALTVGTYPDASNSGQGNYLAVDGPGGCNTDTGSFTVKQAVFSGTTLEHFDATFVQHCDGAVPDLTGEMKYQSAPVVTAPPRVSSLAAKRKSGKITLAWKNPAYSGYRYTVVRLEPGRPAGVGSAAGAAAYAGSGHQTTISGLSAAGTYTIVIYTVDQYGNVSAPAELAVAG